MRQTRVLARSVRASEIQTSSIGQHDRTLVSKPVRETATLSAGQYSERLSSIPHDIAGAFAPLIARSPYGESEGTRCQSELSVRNGPRSTSSLGRTPVISRCQAFASAKLRIGVPRHSPSKSGHGSGKCRICKTRTKSRHTRTIGKDIHASIIRVRCRRKSFKAISAF